MGWVKEEVKTSEEIFRDLITEFGEKWEIAYLPHGNGSAYEHFSDYIRDNHDVTLKQCDELCKRIKKYYNIDKFYTTD